MSSNGLNRVLIIGNIGAVELRHTHKGEAVLNFRVAATETWKDRDGNKQERTEWVSCVLWGKRGEALSRIIAKGTRLYVEGSLKTSEYEKNGEKRYKTEVNVRDVILLDGKRDGGSRGAGTMREPPPGTFSGGPDIEDPDSIPF